MTRLGEMLVELGKEEGLTVGRAEGLIAGREEGLTLGREEGLTAGRGEGIDRVNRLNDRLIREKRYADLERATKDKAYQKHLFEEYSIL